MCLHNLQMAIAKAVTCFPVAPTLLPQQGQILISKAFRPKGEGRKPMTKAFVDFRLVMIGF